MTVTPADAQVTTEAPRPPWWFHPAVLIAGPVSLSIMAWALLAVSGVLERYSPAVSTKLMGFATPAEITLPGLVLLGTFYCFLAWIASIGWSLGWSSPGPAQRPPPPVSERRYFFGVFAVATVGVGYCYATVASRRSIISALSSQLGNQLYDSLPQNAGVQTLRYACILAAPLGIYLWRKGTVGVIPMVAAVMLLGLNALLSSRLSLLMATVVYVTIRVRTREPKAGPPRRLAPVVLTVLVVGFLVLTGLNYSRNANFYRDLGVADPVAMNVYQTSQYLSVPAQVSVGVADSVMTGKWHVPSGPMSGLNAVTPTFLQENKVRKSDKKKYSADYGYSMAFAPQYFTNSVFADTYAEFGAWGWFYTFIIYGVAGYIMARLMRGVPVVAATAGVIAYCFAEVWRIQILSYGFVIFLVMLTMSGAWLARIRES